MTHNMPAAPPAIGAATKDSALPSSFESALFRFSNTHSSIALQGATRRQFMPLPATTNTFSQKLNLAQAKREAGISESRAIEESGWKYTKWDKGAFNNSDLDALFAMF